MTSANNLHRKAAAPILDALPAGEAEGIKFYPRHHRPRPAQFRIRRSPINLHVSFHRGNSRQYLCAMSTQTGSKTFLSRAGRLTVGPPSLGNFPTCSFRDHQRTLLPALQFSTECTNQVLIGLFIDPHRLIGDGNS